MDIKASFKIFNQFRYQPKEFAVIGLGRFGRAVCGELRQLGCDVLATDRDEKLVNQALTDKITSHAVQLDATEASALKEAGIFEFDVVIIAIGDYIQESIVATLNVKENGVKYVVAKASSHIHGKLLKRVGADRVVFPERDAGNELARYLAQPGILDKFELDPEHSIVSIQIPEAFDGQTLESLDLRTHYGLNVIAIKYGEKFEYNPPGNYRLHKGLKMIVVGANSDIKRLPTDSHQQHIQSDEAGELEKGV
ncbi:TrkA family potassium uptake protein [Euhalothece natronophila Z-M001]|uniref:TrkA family potassium uptake protein n=1 Tax=Euhalothece natronophila Z-M001 TaxID=522448 RepID=A0A5B8NRX0_9CHRO|nr:TrkA family potassium uptake protein [Euhalothece natronophila]QDZ41261.1 TrkA family potassium uptake protein [Euhalothece natronophila Z-M001]